MTDGEAQLMVLTSLLLRGAPTDVIRDTAPSLVSLARKNVVLVRLQDRVGVGPRWAELHAAAEEERVRVGRCAELIGEITAICERGGIRHVFPKAFQHYPDMGNDVDVLVEGRAEDVDRALLEGLRARPGTPGAFDRIAGKTGLWRDGWPAPIEVHHRRLGQVGEQTGLAAEAIANRRPVTIAGVRTWVPAADDEVLIQAYQRVCCHLSLRVADVLKGTAFIADREKDWPRIWDRAKRCGLEGALRVYLAHIGRFAERADDGRRPAGEHASSVRPVKNGQYTIALGGVLAAYAVEMRKLVTSAEWDGLVRLAMAPGTLVVARSRAMLRAVGRIHPPSHELN